MSDTKIWLGIDDLAQEIRRVDGNHSLGAGALAEALMPFIESRIAELEAAQAVPVERVELHRIAQLKLDRLKTQGYAVNGYALEKRTGDTVSCGFITNWGTVRWWASRDLESGIIEHEAAAPSPQAEPPQLSALQQYDLERSPEYQKGRADGRAAGYDVGYRHAKEQLAANLHAYEEIAEHYAKCAISPEALRDWVAERMGDVTQDADSREQGFPLMKAAFRTFRSGGGKYEMVFSFPTMDAMQDADEEWRTAIAAIQAKGGEK
jgi:hypothetical protein